MVIAAVAPLLGLLGTVTGMISTFEIITEHGAVVFNGDGYSDNWQTEAAARGLPNLKTTLDAVPELIKSEAVEVFEKYGVFSERELHSRYEVRLEQYAAMGIVSGPTSELVGSLEAGGAEEIASSPVDVDAATDRSGLSAAFDTGTD